MFCDLENRREPLDLDGRAMVGVLWFFGDEKLTRYLGVNLSERCTQRLIVNSVREIVRPVIQYTHTTGIRKPVPSTRQLAAHTENTRLTGVGVCHSRKTRT